MTVTLFTRPVCDRCGALNDTDGSICIDCHGSVDYHRAPTRVEVSV
jgi:ribosomal protein L40E